MSVTVLVAYGSSRGGTAGIATLVGEALREEGIRTDVRDASEVLGVHRYDAVVLGGALYATRWHRDAVWFARRYRRQLRERPLWMFSSGPLDDSASVEDVPATTQVAAIARRLGARGHRTFGGRLEADASGWIAQRMAASGLAGDYRDAADIRAWARDIASGLTREPVRS